jgi:hypothetical protein
MKGYLKPEVADMADFLISEKPNLFQDRFWDGLWYSNI